MLVVAGSLKKMLERKVLTVLRNTTEVCSYNLFKTIYVCIPGKYIGHVLSDC